jgi:hypothetical protein
MPCYDAHLRLAGYESTNVLYSAIDVASAAVSSGLSEGSVVELQLELIRNAEIPIDEPNKRWSAYREMGLLAWRAVEALLQFLQENKTKRIDDISAWAVAAVEEWVALTGFYAPMNMNASYRLHEVAGLQQDCIELMWRAPNPDPEAWFENSPMVVAEKNKQKYDIEVLRRHPEPSSLLFDALRRSSREQGIQPILRGFVLQS